MYVHKLVQRIQHITYCQQQPKYVPINGSTSQLNAASEVRASKYFESVLTLQQTVLLGGDASALASLNTVPAGHAHCWAPSAVRFMSLQVG
jgi:hypothetical protein